MSVHVSSVIKIHNLLTGKVLLTRTWVLTMSPKWHPRWPTHRPWPSTAICRWRTLCKSRITCRISSALLSKRPLFTERERNLNVMLSGIVIRPPFTKNIGSTRRERRFFRRRTKSRPSASFKGRNTFAHIPRNHDPFAQKGILLLRTYLLHIGPHYSIDSRSRSIPVDNK